MRHVHADFSLQHLDRKMVNGADARRPVVIFPRVRLEKGNQVAITGSLSSRIYEDKNKITKTITEIMVDEFMKISKSAEASTDSSQSTDTDGAEVKVKPKRARSEEAVPF